MKTPADLAAEIDAEQHIQPYAETVAKLRELAEHMLNIHNFSAVAIEQLDPADPHTAAVRDTSERSLATAKLCLHAIGTMATLVDTMQEVILAHQGTDYARFALKQLGLTPASCPCCGERRSDHEGAQPHLMHVRLNKN